MPGLLAVYVTSVVALALPVVAVAAARVAIERPDPRELLLIGALASLAFLSDLKPVPIDDTDGRAVSLAFVFVLVAMILFGWEYAVLIGFASIVTAQALERQERHKIAFNGAAYALAALAASVTTMAVGRVPDGDIKLLAYFSFVGGALFVAVNVLLVCGAVALHSGARLVPLLRDNLRTSGPAFVIMAFIAALAETLWVREPAALVLLAGPLVTLTLYQRHALASKVASRAALLDSLTGLGNHRAFEEGLDEALAHAEASGEPFSLCVVDTDAFKEINDTYGHPVGDSVLRMAASVLERETGQAFRLGGDEFALIAECDEQGAARLAQRLQQSLGAIEFGFGARVTFSAGIASFPRHGTVAADIQLAADHALYWAKEHGRNLWCVFSPAMARPDTPEELARRAERNARMRAAENLSRIVDAKDTYVGMHSQSVAQIAVEIARELQLDEEAIAHVGLSGRLHDLGKIAIPDHVLQKASSLSPDELQLMRTHSDLGASLLDGLDISPVDTWIRHHHEHWNGSGYPHGMAGDEIPLGSRIILVADAFDAMTSDRSYRAAMTTAEALEELWRNAGRQFDPVVVAAFTRWIVKSASYAMYSLPELETPEDLLLEARLAA